MCQTITMSHAGKSVEFKPEVLCTCCLGIGIEVNELNAEFAQWVLDTYKSFRSEDYSPKVELTMF